MTVRKQVEPGDLDFSYRSSQLKKKPGQAIVLTAEFKLRRCDPAQAVALVGELLARRRVSQPVGSSLGSMFENPPGDYAGRLIEAAGLKGFRMGNAEISTEHANFFLNLGDARAEDIRGLMDTTRRTVREKFGIELEPEIVLAGEWPSNGEADMGKMRIGVIFGGRSGEHEVSLMSARSVLDALDRSRYEVVEIGITPEGVWMAGEGVMQALQNRTAKGARAALFAEPGPARIWEIRPNGNDEERHLKLFHEVDVIFPVLHGTFGEDGTLQGLLEMAEIPYVGAGVLASAVAMDKALFKQLMRAHGVPVVDYALCTRGEIAHDLDNLVRRVETLAPYPLFTKPANLGSSVGISRCANRSDLVEGMADAARYDRRVLIERGIDAREIEVSVLGNEQPQASVPGEVLPSREFYSYESKYLDGTSKLLIPAPLPEDKAVEIQRWAVEAYRAIDGAGLARADFLLDRRSGEAYINELNTMPGFTSISMYAKLWEQSGLPYPALLDRLVALAFERHTDRTKSERNFRKN